MKNMIGVVTPIDHPNQRNFKVNQDTHDIVLLSMSGAIYIHSMYRDYLRKIAMMIGIINPEITDIRGKERQYEGLSGYLLESPYRSLSGGVKSIRVLLRNHDHLISILDEEMI